LGHGIRSGERRRGRGVVGVGTNLGHQVGRHSKAALPKPITATAPQNNNAKKTKGISIGFGDSDRVCLFHKIATPSEKANKPPAAISPGNFAQPTGSKQNSTNASWAPINMIKKANCVRCSTNEG